MPTLDHCINAVFEPGNIGASSGLVPVSPTVPSFFDPDDYDPGAVTYSLDFTKYYNSMYAGAI